MDFEWFEEKFSNRKIFKRILKFRGQNMQNMGQNDSLDLILPLELYKKYEKELFKQDRGVIKGQLTRQRKVLDSWWVYYRTLLSAIYFSSQDNCRLYRPYHYDSTGRMYPFGVETSIQGNMLMRALHEFDVEGNDEQIETNWIFTNLANQIGGNYRVVLD